MKDQPAFPIQEIDGGVLSECAGLTKLEWYAGMALQGILACDGWIYSDEKTAAEEAFELAEAMCAEAEKRKGKE